MSLLQDLQKAAESAVREGVKVAKQAGRKAGQLAHDNRDKIDSAIDKTGKVVDEKTGGKFTSKIEGVKTQAARGVDLVEKSRPGHADPTDATDGESAGGPQDALWEDDGGVAQPGDEGAYDAARDAGAANPDPGVGEFGTTTGGPGNDESGTPTS
ncbi:MAG: antitoxin [Dermatophilaceae bacterium]